MAQPISDGVDAPLETHSKTIDSSIFQLPHPKRKRVVITPLKLIDNYDSDEDLNLEDLDECVDSETDSDSSLTVSDGSETMVESSDSDNRSLGSEMDVSNSELVGEHGNACLYTARDGTKWFENSNSDVATLNILPSDHKAYPTEYCKDANSIKGIYFRLFAIYGNVLLVDELFIIPNYYPSSVNQDRYFMRKCTNQNYVRVHKSHDKN